MQITFEDNGSPLKKSKNRHGETCEEQLRSMCKTIAENITAGGGPDITKGARSASEFMEDVYDIRYYVNGEKRYLGAELLVAGGGPTIWVNTYTKQVEGYWWGDKVLEPFSDELDLDGYCEEMYGC